MYRFQLATPGSLADLKELDLEIGDFYQLKPDEFICALASWKLMKDADEMLIVTSKGYARSYSLELLVESIEGPTPTTFDQPLPGIPLLAAGVNPSSQLIVISDSCRAVRYPLNELPTHGLQAINRRDEDRLTGAITGHADQEIVIITENGYGKRMIFGDVPTPPKPNTRGRVIISRKRTAGIVALADDRTILAITEEAMVPFDPYQLPLDRSGSTKSFPIPELHEAGRVVGMVAINGPVSSASSG
jgi:DNA gyrase/topoisomerase IV subunit A